MNRPAIFALGVVAAGAVAAIVGFLALPQRFHLESASSPKSGVVVRGLPFKSGKGHPLDGALRLFIGDHTRQTDIPFTRELTIEWIGSDSVETFSVNAKGSTLMKWRMEGAGPVCFSGQEHLVSDPCLHQASGGDPSSQPGPAR